jgi:hypothetical protein
MVIINKLMENTLVNCEISFIDQDVRIFSLNSACLCHSMLHLGIMSKLGNSRVIFFILSSKTLLWNIVWVEPRHLFIIKFEPIILPCSLGHRLSLLNE